MVEIKLIEMTCFSCGVTFWISNQLDKDLLRTKKKFYCPAGHPQIYVGKSDKDKLEEALNEIDKCNTQHNINEEKIKDLKKSISTYKGHLARNKK